MSEPLSDADLLRITEYCEKATPAPWERYHDNYESGTWLVMSKDVAASADGTVPVLEGVERVEDAEFCAKARTDLPRLVEELKAARRVADENYTDLLDQMDGAWGVNFTEVGGAEIRAFLESRIVHKPTTSLRREVETLRFKLGVRTSAIEGKDGWREENESLRAQLTAAQKRIEEPEELEGKQ